MFKKKKQVFAKTTLDWSRKFYRHVRLAVAGGLLVSLYITYYIYVSIETARYEKDTVDMYVVSHNIEQYTEVTERDLELISIRRDLIPEKAIFDKEKLIGQVTLFEMTKGQIPVEPLFIQNVNQDSIGLLLEKNKYAFTIGYDWFVSPVPELQVGDFVDIITATHEELLTESGQKVANPRVGVSAQELKVIKVSKDSGFNSVPYFVVMVDADQARNLMGTRLLGAYFNVLIRSNR